MRVSCVYRRSNPHFVPQQTILNSIEIDNKAKIKLNTGVLGKLIEWYDSAYSKAPTYRSS